MTSYVWALISSKKWDMSEFAKVMSKGRLLILPDSIRIHGRDFNPQLDELIGKGEPTEGSVKNNCAGCFTHHLKGKHRLVDKLNSEKWTNRPT